MMQSLIFSRECTRLNRVDVWVQPDELIRLRTNHKIVTHH